MGKNRNPPPPCDINITNIRLIQPTKRRMKTWYTFPWHSLRRVWSVGKKKKSLIPDPIPVKHHEFPRFSHVLHPLNVFGIQPVCRRPLVTYTLPVLHASPPDNGAQNSYSHPPFGSLSRREIYRSPVASPRLSLSSVWTRPQDRSYRRRRGPRFPPPFGLSRPSLTGRFAPFSPLSPSPSWLETIPRRTSPAKKVSKFLATAKTTRTPPARGIGCDKGWMVARRYEGRDERALSRCFPKVVIEKGKEERAFVVILRKSILFYSSIFEGSWCRRVVQFFRKMNFFQVFKNWLLLAMLFARYKKYWRFWRFLFHDCLNDRNYNMWFMDTDLVFRKENKWFIFILLKLLEFVKFEEHRFFGSIINKKIKFFIEQFLFRFHVSN